ncbi:MAG TPA: hypothetical protein VKJ00_03535 [Thermoanaerobaculia bacterium]|nr:hypothetical protein [Thermoanaerobaculia bacterium]
MNGSFVFLVLAVLASPVVAYFVYRLAKELGFLDPPIDRQHDLKRTIVVSLYAFLLFLPVGIYGTEKQWPRVWVFFGLMVGVAMAIFAYGGIRATRELWKLRHPEPVPPGTADSVLPEAAEAPAVSSPEEARSDELI